MRFLPAVAFPFVHTTVILGPLLISFCSLYLDFILYDGTDFWSIPGVLHSILSATTGILSAYISTVPPHHFVLHSLSLNFVLLFCSTFHSFHLRLRMFIKLWLGLIPVFSKVWANFLCRATCWGSAFYCFKTFSCTMPLCISSHFYSLHSWVCIGISSLLQVPLFHGMISRFLADCFSFLCLCLCISLG